VLRYQKRNSIEKLLIEGDNDVAFFFLKDWAKLRKLNTCMSRVGTWSGRCFRVKGTLNCHFSHSVNECCLLIKYSPNNCTRVLNYITSLQTPNSNTSCFISGNHWQAKCKVLNAKHPFCVPSDTSSFPFDWQLATVWILHCHQAHWTYSKVLLATLWKPQVKSSLFQNWENNWSSSRFIFDRSLLWQTEMSCLPSPFF